MLTGSAQACVSYTFLPFRCFSTLAGLCTDSLSELYRVAKVYIAAV